MNSRPVLIALTLLGCVAGVSRLAAQDLSSSNLRMNSDPILLRYAITLRAGWKNIPPGEGASAAAIAAIERRNRFARLQGIPDELNPNMIDIDRVKSLFADLPAIPGEQLERLRGQTVNLQDVRLDLYTWSVLRSSGGRPVSHHVDAGVPGEAPCLVPEGIIDAAMAHARIALAQKLIAAADAEVNALDRQFGASGGDREAHLARSSAARRRSYAAGVWRQLSAQLAAANPSDRDLAAGAAAAAAAHSRYLVPPFDGLPPPDDLPAPGDPGSAAAPR